MFILLVLVHFRINLCKDLMLSRFSQHRSIFELALPPVLIQALYEQTPILTHVGLTFLLLQQFQYLVGANSCLNNLSLLKPTRVTNPR